MAKKNRSQEHEGDTGEQGPGISRRGLFIGSGAAAAAVTLGAASPAAAASTAAAVSTAVTASGDAPSGSGSTGDLLLVNGRIHLGDAGDTVVSSVRISDGRFVAIGRDADRSNGGTATRIDLRGRTVIP